MFELLVNKFLKDKSRKSIGLLCGIVSIVCNTILALSKIIIGLLCGSVAIISDGLNNLSDLGSNLATIVGFLLAEKHPDHDHPYGHGRYEYIAGMVIAFMILLIACSTLKESVLRMIHPKSITFTFIAFMILIISIGIKLFMSYFNQKGSVLIDSVSLHAASIDSRNDCLTTIGAIISLCLSYRYPVLDGLIGTIVSGVVILSGIEILKDTISPLLGQAPDPKLVQQIYDLVNHYDITLGIHDFILHDYGPSKKYLTFHLEVDSTLDMVSAHNQVDKMEREILETFNIMTVIHYDPIDINSKLVHNLYHKVKEIVREEDEHYSIHDFRIEENNEKPRMLFDILIPSDDHKDHQQVIHEIENKLNDLKLNYEYIIQVDHE